MGARADARRAARVARRVCGEFDDLRRLWRWHKVESVVHGNLGRGERRGLDARRRRRSTSTRHGLGGDERRKDLHRWRVVQRERGVGDERCVRLCDENLARGR